MDNTETTKISKNLPSFISLPFVIAALFIGLSIFLLKNHREYSAGNILTKEENEKDAGSQGMIKFFFNARRNQITNKMDYKSMVDAQLADQAMADARKNRSVSSTAGSVPDFNWLSMGPTSVLESSGFGGGGGRTRAILIDNNDPTHQTVFAGSVTGGIWKSTDGGSHWGNTIDAISFSQNDSLQSLDVECIAQDSHGAIYIGGGEGVVENNGTENSDGTIGCGIFKSTDDGTTWRLLPNASLKTSNDESAPWAFVNRIAVLPNNFQVVYAATGTGLYISYDSGATWRGAYNNATGKALFGSTGYNSFDVKVSADGSVVIADINGFGFIAYPLSRNDSDFTEIHYTGAGKLPGNASRIEFAISPSDPNRIYCSDIQGYTFENVNSGIFMTTNALSSGNGGYWYDIGPGGTIDFEPYISAADQSVYDNTIAVYPNNEGQLLIGGTSTWQWTQATTNDTTGSWQKVSHYSEYYQGDPLYVHGDEHAMVFDMNNPNVLYIGCDGGVYKSTNAMNAEVIGEQMTYQPYNRNYTVQQCYHICYSPQVNYINNVPYGNTTMTLGMGMGFGCQDNGSPYLNGNGAFPNDGPDMTGGDGNGCAVSQLNPDIAYFSADSYLEREANLSSLSQVTSGYSSLQGRCVGADIEASATASGAANFVLPVALYENPYDLLNHDSILYTANKNYSAGDTVWPQSANGPLYYPYVLTKALLKDSSLMVPDRVVSRLAVGFTGADGIWINGQGASSGTVVWKPIGGTMSKPDAYSDGGTPHALAWSSDGDALWVGTDDGGVYRFSNLNAVVSTEFCSGALWWDSASAAHLTGDTTVKCTSINSQVGGRDVLSIATDPNNVDNVMVTAGNYGNTAYVYYCTNATATSPTFASVQGNLPAMPVYSCILDIDSAGQFLSGSAMVGTEHGIYTTSKLNGSNTKWVKNGNHFPNDLTFDIKQQTFPPYECNNSGVIYAGTLGRGIWSTNDLYVPTAVQSISSTTPSINSLEVYPNPMTTQGNIEFNLSATDNLIINIYDIQGKEVKTINLQTQAPGDHIVTFSSSDLQPGTYFASLTGTKFRKVCKFIVVK